VNPFGAQYAKSGRCRSSRNEFVPVCAIYDRAHVGTVELTGPWVATLSTNRVKLSGKGEWYSQMNDRQRKQLVDYLNDARDIENSAAVNRWSRRVEMFLTEALGVDVSLDSKVLRQLMNMTNWP
jgi:hypothetical protein